MWWSILELLILSHHNSGGLFSEPKIQNNLLSSSIWKADVNTCTPLVLLKRKSKK
jgi:hypothetical protein